MTFTAFRLSANSDARWSHILKPVVFMITGFLLAGIQDHAKQGLEEVYYVFINFIGKLIRIAHHAQNVV